MLSWGINDYGQLGNGSTTYETKPCEVCGLEEVDVADIAAGGWHSMAISHTGGESALHELRQRGSEASLAAIACVSPAGCRETPLPDRPAADESPAPQRSIPGVEGSMGG